METKAKMVKESIGHETINILLLFLAASLTFFRYKQSSVSCLHFYLSHNITQYILSCTENSRSVLVQYKVLISLYYVTCI